MHTFLIWQAAAQHEIFSRSTTFSERFSMERMKTGLQGATRCFGVCAKGGLRRGIKRLVRWKLPVCTRLLQWKHFESVSITLIIVNTAILACYHYGMSDAFEHSLELSNLVLTQLFALELFIKLLGTGAKGFVRNGWYVFDTLIVLATEIEIAFPAANVSVLRSVRLMRIFQLAKSFHGLQKIIAAFVASLSQVVNFFFIFGLVLFIFALLGVELLAGQYTEANGFPPQVEAEHGGLVPAVPYHFDTFPVALVTVFVVVSGENWNDVWYSAHQAIGAGAGVYFVALVVIGNFMLLNLFVAILLGHFDSKPHAAIASRFSLVRQAIIKYRERAPPPLDLLLFPPEVIAERRAKAASEGGGEVHHSLARCNTYTGGLSVGEYDCNPKRGSCCAGTPRSAAAAAATTATADPLAAARDHSRPPASPPASPPERASNRPSATARASDRPSALKGSSWSETSDRPSERPSARFAQPPPERPDLPPRLSRRKTSEEIAQSVPASTAALHPNNMASAGSSFLQRDSAGPSPDPNLSPSCCYSSSSSVSPAACLSSLAGRSSSKRSSVERVSFTAERADSRRYSTDARRRIGPELGSSQRFSAGESGGQKQRRPALRGPSDRVSNKSIVATLHEVHATDCYIPALDRDHALCLFPRSHPLRVAVVRLVSSADFDRAVLALIVLNSLCMAAPLFQCLPGSFRTRALLLLLLLAPRRAPSSMAGTRAPTCAATAATTARAASTRRFRRSTTSSSARSRSRWCSRSSRTASSCRTPPPTCATRGTCSTSSSSSSRSSPFRRRARATSPHSRRCARCARCGRCA